MTQSEQSVSVRNTRWANDGRVKAVCNVAGCGWTKLGGQGVAVAAAKRHALTTGHSVYLVRRQLRFTFPEGYSS